MATNGDQQAFAPTDVLAAVLTLRGGEQQAKEKAHEYLQSFQKSVRAGLEQISLGFPFPPFSFSDWS